MGVINGTVEVSNESFVDVVSQTVRNILGSRLKLQLVSVKLDPVSRDGKRSKLQVLKMGASVLDLMNRSRSSPVASPDEKRMFPVDFSVDEDFGMPGAIIVENDHPLGREFFLESITLQIQPNQQILFPTKSWIYPSKIYPGPRIFFSNEAYLPCETPEGILKLRRDELIYLRGDGTGVRKTGERIYDYDLYNNLGNPDLDEKLTRPVLGGSKELPYPRRCRTGGKHTKKDPSSESPTASTYLPRDEVFSPLKNRDITKAGIKASGHEAQTLLNGYKHFSKLEEVYDLYAGKLDPTLSTQYVNSDGTLFKFPPPTIVQASIDAWTTDQEFARQRLAGMNPMRIERLKVFPPETCLDSTIYGHERCNITEDHIKDQLAGLTIEQALNEKRLYILDYHDSFITPYITRINETEGKIYASRSLFFLTSSEILMPIAIELILPPKAKDEPWVNRVFTPPLNEETNWLWQLAKGHVALLDTIHQHLCSHWLKTHACMEPFVIATRRHLSAMHPLHMLLSPHFKDTMATNQGARETFLNSNGRIERCFVSSQYSNQLSSMEYKNWRFDEQALPNDLIRRGMAEEDKDAKHGLKLHVKDYPYAEDGLEIWGAIKCWVEEYIEIYYSDEDLVAKDDELQAWWEEIKEIGHADHRGATWWHEMKTKKDTIQVITTLIWLASGFHSVVGIGQYSFAGFMPNSPTMGTRLIPEVDTAEYKSLIDDPIAFFLSSFSSRRDTTTLMGTFEITSQHMSEEVYLGDTNLPPPTNHPLVLSAHLRFKNSIKLIHDHILECTTSPSSHRAGPSKMPFSLLLPFSPPGLTSRGVPNSISI